MTNRRTLIAALIAALVCPLAAQAAVSPYTPDGDTLHLWHFDDGSSPATDSVGSEDLTVTNGATLGAAALSGFGTAMNVSNSPGDDAGAYGSEGTPVSGFVDATTGAFTFEALVRPTASLGSAGMQIISMEDEGGGASRPFQFRIQNDSNLNFINIENGSSPAAVAVPTTGPNAYAVGEWFHVAATYNGNEAGSDNFSYYWTKVEAGRTRANVLAVETMGADLAGTGDFAIGNEARDTPTGSFVGQMDEARISSTARTGDAFIFSKPQYDNVLLADSFNTASTGINDDLASRQTGLLATTNYNVNGGGSTSITSNQLEMGAGGFTAFSPDIDFATGAAATAIANGGGFVIDFDTNPVSGANDTGGDGDWLAVSIGRTLANSTSTAPGITQGDVDFGLLVRDNGMLTLWDGGSTSITPSANAFDLDPTAGETYNIRLMVNTDDANSGTAATVSLFVNGVQFDLTDGAGLTYGFNWDANNTNYIAFESRGDPVTLDNLLIAAIPTPAALPAGLALMTLTLMRRRRK